MATRYSHKLICGKHRLVICRTKFSCTRQNHSGGYVWSFPAGPGDIPCSIAIFVSAMITLFATVLITLKIMIVTRRSQVQHSYTKVIEILIESATTTSAILLLDSILLLIASQRSQPQNTDTLSELLPWLILNYVEAIRVPITVCLWYNIPNYVKALTRLVKGISPTLISFRVVQKTRTAEIHPTGRRGFLSRLTFKRLSLHPETNSKVLSV